MTFLRSPVLAIFAIMLALPDTNVDTNIAAHALDVFELPPSWAGRIESSGTSRKDCPGLGPRQESEWRRTAIEALLQVYTTAAYRKGFGPALGSIGPAGPAGSVDEGAEGTGGIGAG
jgi:hypothetical protein